MAKYENIRALAKKQLQAVTESSDRWKAFLRTAAIAYNYSFPNQLLIHEQSPTATAVADIAYWNNNAGRWVKRGAHGIAVFDTRANSSRLRYLFDISDTIPRAEIPEALPWVITDQNWRPVWDKIVADNHADSIQSALLMLSTSCVAQRSAMFTTALGNAIDGSSLQWAKPDEQRQLFLQLITQSCLYMAALRCGVDTARLDLSALESVNQFDTNRITLCLGSACQQAARPLMQQIGSITREIDSVARAEKVRYYGDKQEETNNTKEVNNGVHDGERLPNPGADAERAADAGNRQVRQPAAEILARERAGGVRRDAVGGNAVPASGGDGQRGTPANRADDADADAAEHRPEPADRPDGLDAVDERLAEPSRGTGDAADLQPVIQEPQAESDTTPSAFSVPISDLPPLSDELILGLLAKESSSRADNAAILEYFNEHPDLAERSAFCKHCYKQIYTYLFVDDHTVGFIRHDMYLELLLENALNLRATKIYDTIYDENGKEQHKLNGPATEEAQAKQRMIEDAFKDWIFKDRERREILVALYNEKFNCIRPREYDGSHIQFFGMNPEIALRSHQRNAIAHILYGHNTLLAHVVGAGKTYEMVAAAMEKKRLGLCSKTLVAVPNHLTGQFASEALKLYPNANILVTTQRDFEKSNRKRFCAKIATGNYDIVVIGHSQFEKIPLSDARKAEFIRKQIDELEMQLESMDNSDSRLTVKQLESKKKQLKTKLSNLLDAPKRDDVVTFEELGADSLMVDEAHNFKNLMTVTKMHNIAGISTTESQKASDLFMKCQYLDEITGARGVTFATGTPISNSMTELYTMQRYLQQYTLERNGLANFDSWAATFGETVTAIELAPEGTGYRTKTRFARFFNLPELMAMFKECADIQTADMLKLPVPALAGGKPTNIQLKPSEIQKQMVAELGERADKIRNKMVKPYEDNMLKITNDGRKLALDQRLIDPDLPDDPDSKVNICVGKIFEIWEQTMLQRSAQLVFCDLSTPKAGVFNVYDDMKAKLIERGIPETEIAFIHEANTDARKTELFGKVRSGAVRVLMGSTAKMGAGTNVQKRLIALHHLDVPWRPSDIEQREGRILRQGNENKEVYVFRYVTEGTFDAYSWQLIENKQKFIGQIMTSKSPARSCDDMDEAALSYAEVKALAAGNPLIKEKMDLDVQLTRLKTLKAAHDSQRYELENKIAIGFPAEIRKCKEQIENATVDAATVKEHSVVDADGKDVFCIQLEKKVYYEKEPAGKALLGLLGLALNSEKPVPIGYFKGMELQIQHLPFGNEYHARLAGSGTYSTQLGADVLGNLTRLSNLANGIEPSIEKTRNMQIQLEQQLASAEEEVKRPFPQATELTEKSKRLAVLEGLLNMNDKDIVTDTEPEQQCQTDNRQRGQEER